MFKVTVGGLASRAAPIANGDAEASEAADVPTAARAGNERAVNRQVRILSDLCLVVEHMEMVLVCATLLRDEATSIEALRCGGNQILLRITSPSEPLQANSSRHHHFVSTVHVLSCLGLQKNIVIA